MNQDQICRSHLLAALRGNVAHLSFEETVKNFPESHYNEKIPGVQYSSWDVLEHMRIGQWDILDFIINPEYQSIEWPDGYWPKEKGGVKKWNGSVDDFLIDRKKLEDMVNDASIDLFSPIPHAPDYTVFKEITLVISHNSYHLGQILTMRKAMGIWPAE